ncbi:MAG: PAS domain-containing protein [Pseudomonas marincola]
MLLRQKSILISVTVISILCILLALIFSLASYSKKLAEAEKQRYRAVILADQLRQSSDDLTRMARTYAVTNNPIYEEYFKHILAIRNGDAERPPNYFGNFWDIVTATGILVKTKSEKKSLQSLLNELDLSSAEVRLLQQAEAASNDLVEMEVTAFNALKGTFKDSVGNFTKTSEPDPELARNILHSKSYHRAKLKIMAPINKFFSEIDERTSAMQTRYSDLIQFHIIAMTALLFALTIIVIISSTRLVANILFPIQKLSIIAGKNKKGDLNLYEMPANQTDEVGVLASAFNQMVTNIQEAINQLEEKTRVAEDLERIAIDAKDEIQLMNNELEKRVIKRTELLEQSEQRLQAIINNANAVIFVKDMEGRYMSVNKRYENLFKVKNDTFIGNSDYDLFPKDVAETFRANDREVMQSGLPIEREEITPHENGSRTYISVKFPLRNSKGEMYGVCGISTDITALKRSDQERLDLERQLRQSQKMDAVGQLTGGIAHDFNNILNIIIGNLELLQDRQNQDPVSVQFLEKALKGTDRAAQLTHKLLNFSRNEDHERQVVYVDASINNLMGLLSKSLTASITVDTKLEDNIWPVKVNTGDLEDSILNLCLNAKDATPNGGNLIIETANKTLDENYVKRNPSGKAGDFVMISISDTGAGMTKEIKEKIFEPFFTTKAAGKGTGLGLSMVYGFVKRSQGHVKIYSEEGKGTVVRLYFPRAISEGPTLPPVPAPRLVAPAGSETILIVEDEIELLDIAVNYLEGLGYQTLTANNAEQAMKILDGPTDIQLMFSDVVMPGNADGYQLAMTVRKTHPQLKIILTSGFTRQHEDTLHEGHEEQAEFERLTQNLLVKPYNKLELALSIRAELDSAN